MILRTSICGLLFILMTCSSPVVAELQVGISEIEVTPSVDADHTVFMAGYGWNRKATGVHDPLYARCTVLSDGKKRIALVSVDVVGLQFPTVERIRSTIPAKSFDYVMISSSHNHEGPDTIGIWGANPFRRGVDESYVTSLVEKVAKCIADADKSKTQVTVQYGTATDERLVRDSRQPSVKDATLRLLRFEKQTATGPKTVGLLVQWNSHPEALGPNNTLITADFPYETIRQLKAEYNCPIAYYSGAVGGLMAPPRDQFRGKDGKLLKEGDFAYAEAYGAAVAELAMKANESATPITLEPISIAASRIAIPVKNPLYRAAAVAKVVSRNRVKWMGDFDKANTPIGKDTPRDEMCIQTEVGFLRLGELSVACVPGEIYPDCWFTVNSKSLRTRMPISSTLRWKSMLPRSCQTTAGCFSDWRTTKSATSFRNDNGIKRHRTRTAGSGHSTARSIVAAQKSPPSSWRRWNVVSPRL